jgi:inosine/xanthosine triphosphatase
MKKMTNGRVSTGRTSAGKTAPGAAPENQPVKTIVIASQNPVKIQAVVNGFQRMFPAQEFTIQAVTVPSGVSPQPRSDAETLQGAINRASAAALRLPDADFWVGIEGGVDETVEGEMVAFAWVAVRGSCQVGRGRTGTFYLPPAVTALLRQGKELGEADDIVFGRTNSKQENGAVGLLTGDVIDRAQLYEHAMILALIPFKNQALYPTEL